MNALFFAAVAALNCSSPATQTDYNDCALRDFNRADAQLNAQWKITFRAYQADSIESAARLRAAQRAWIAFRDAQCDAKHYYDIGISLDHGLNIACRTELTKARARELAEMAKQI